MGFIATYLFTAMSYFLASLYVNKGISVLLVILPSAFLAIWVHGFAHSVVAKKQGLLKNGISKNPFKLMSISGFILLTVFGFGFARTDDVHSNKASRSERLKYHSSGIFANIAVALVLSIIEGILLLFAFLTDNIAFGGTVYFIFDIVIWINISLALTQILPIPGFDGYYILKDLFFMNCRSKVLIWFEKYSKWFFLAAVVIGLTYYWCDLPTNAVFNFIGDIQSKIIDLLTNGIFSASGW